MKDIFDSSFAHREDTDYRIFWNGKRALLSDLFAAYEQNPGVYPSKDAHIEALEALCLELHEKAQKANQAACFLKMELLRLKREAK